MSLIKGDNDGVLVRLRRYFIVYKHHIMRFHNRYSSSYDNILSNNTNFRGSTAPPCYGCVTIFAPS